MNSTDILIVDDDAEYSRELAEYLSRTLGVGVEFALDVSSAELIARRSVLKVALIDQRMPNATGLEVGRKLAGIDGRIRRILLSGEASGPEISSAWKDHFDAHLHKNNVGPRLISEIQLALLRYQSAVLDSLERRSALLHTERGRFGSIKSRIYLVSIDSIDQNFVLEDSWVSHRQLLAGEEREEIADYEWSRSESVEVADVMSAGAEAATHVANLVAGKLRAEVARRAWSGESTITRHGVKVTRRLSLPMPAPGAAVHIASRTHQYAPVYRRTSVTITSECGCCAHNQLFRVFLFDGTHRVATRYVDHLSDGSEDVVITGEADAY